MSRLHVASLVAHRWLACMALFVATLTLPLRAARAQELPAGAAAISVRDTGAKGDGVTDDTQAINAAFAGLYQAWEEIYLPAGTYLISGPIDVGRFQTLRGAGPGKTILKLKNAAPSYGDKSKPNWVLRSWRGCCADDQNDNQTQSVHILNLSVDVGDDNPGAIAVNFLSNNGGGLENVVLKAGSNSGSIGIRLERNSPGPALINNVKILGFDYGITTGWGAYGMTFEDIELSGQHMAGWKNNGQPLAIRHLLSTNTVPAIQSQTEDYGLLLLLDSTLNGGDATHVAIESQGNLYLRNVCTSGYRAALANGQQELPSPIVELNSAETTAFGDSAKRSLNLPIRDMFVPQWDPPTEWANVNDYPSFQAAFDSGKSTVYFPNYTNPDHKVAAPLKVRGALRNIIGLNAGLSGATLSIETTDASATIYVEQLRNFVLEHRSPATVVIRRSLGDGPLSTYAGAGALLVDDWCCGSFRVQGSNVWVRQLNEESTTEKLVNSAGKLWVLGLKTEQSTTVGHFTDHSATEILGGLIYPAQGTPTTPMYINDNSDFSAIHRQLGEYPIMSREIHGGVTTEQQKNTISYVSNTGNQGSALAAADCSVVAQGGRAGSGGTAGTGGQGASGAGTAGSGGTTGSSVHDASAGGGTVSIGGSGGAASMTQQGGGWAVAGGGGWKAPTPPSADRGCGCRLPSSRASGSPWSVISLALCALMLLRRRIVTKA